jgi:hypothetical protein
MPDNHLISVEAVEVKRKFGARVTMDEREKKQALRISFRREYGDLYDRVSDTEHE